MEANKKKGQGLNLENNSVSVENTTATEATKENASLNTNNEVIADTNEATAAKKEKVKQTPKVEQVADNSNEFEQEQVLSEDDEEAEQYGVFCDESTKKLMFRDRVGLFVLSDHLYITNAIKNLDTQAVIIEFTHESCYCKNVFNGTLCDIKESKLYNFLASKGVLVADSCIAVLADYLTKEIDNYIASHKMKYIHQRIGWGVSKDSKKSYFSSKSINAPYQSYLKGNEDNFLGPNGSRAKYDEMVQKEIIPNKNMQVPFVLAFTAPLVPIMFDKTACPVLMTNFAGKSSHGKSTSTALIASVWGKGIITNHRLAVAKTFASTQNGFEAAVNENNGLPVLFDDYESASKSTNFGQLIYSLAQGESKIRCDKSGSIKDTFSWRTYIGFTGETSIFERAGGNLGLKPRIVEFKNTPWTSSKENSINITGTIAQNYGFYGEEFVKGLMNKPKEELENLYDESEKIINAKAPPMDNVSDRIQTRLSLIRMTAVLVREIMDLDIDVDYITQFLIDNEISRQENFDVDQVAKEELLEFFNKNLTSFIRKDYAQNITVIPNSKIFGKIYKGDQGNLIAVLPEYLKSVLDKCCNDKDTILEKWRDEGFLVTENPKRFTKKVSLTGYVKPPRCYVFAYELHGDNISNAIQEDEIDIRSLEEEDIRSRVTKAPKAEVVCQNGERYVRVPKKDCCDVVPKTTEFHEYPPVKEPRVRKIEPKACTETFDEDDDEVIEKLFEDKSEDNQ